MHHILTGLNNAEICQLSAVLLSGQATFDKYAVPNHGISHQASLANKLTVVAGQLLYKLKPVNSLTLPECLKEFVNFLKSLKCKVVLAAHNGKLFDSRILVKALLVANLLTEFKTAVIGFVDTLPVFKQLLPGRKSYKQEELVRDCLTKSYDAHNGLEDVKSLKDLLLHLKPENSILSSNSFDVEFVCQFLQHHARKTANFPSLRALVTDKVLSKSVAQRIAGSGLNLQQLQLIHARGGYDGLRTVLNTKQGLNKQCQVITSKKVLRMLSDYLVKK